MNILYKMIWNEVLGVWVVVLEVDWVKGKGGMVVWCGCWNIVGGVMILIVVVVVFFGFVFFGQVYVQVNCFMVLYNFYSGIMMCVGFMFIVM